MFIASQSMYRKNLLNGQTQETDLKKKWHTKTRK